MYENDESPQTRKDPVEIIARVSVLDPERAREVWIHLATRDGWAVEVLNADHQSVAEARSLPIFCGRVEIEGIPYVIQVGPRVRHSLMEVVNGEWVNRPVLDVAAWVEPEVSAETAPTVFE
ncbi:hypothetical protein ACIBBD_11505 [Streptomyces sp. NPDC051315]|jgi:hypothetical protein|uniref:hypothetical protein n=1 Tax=Streptomyces sp. NPDC051315 TaxID=3365650 RepID=UPI0037AA0758